jgi:hypothetical protein
MSETTDDILRDIRELLAIIAYEVVLRLPSAHIKPAAATKLRQLSAALKDYPGE